MEELPTDFQAFVFDAYGTLFDVHSAVARLADEIGQNAPQISNLWRTKQLEYTWVRSLANQYKDFQTITEESLDFALAAHGINNPTLKDKLLNAYRTLDTFPEVEVVLKEIRSHGKQIAILSNGTPSMLKDAIDASAVRYLLDHIISVDPIKTYKTDPETYRLCADTLGVPPDTICFLSSNRWDIAGAKKFGFYCLWVNRYNAPQEYNDMPPDKIAPDLRILVHG